jgi:hypothetical protein
VTSLKRPRKKKAAPGRSDGFCRQAEERLDGASGADAADVAGLTTTVFDAVMTFTQGRQTDDIALLAFRHTGDA